MPNAYTVILDSVTSGQPFAVAVVTDGEATVMPAHRHERPAAASLQKIFDSRIASTRNSREAAEDKVLSTLNACLGNQMFLATRVGYDSEDEAMTNAVRFMNSVEPPETVLPRKAE
jgi:hypothetical protein